MQRRQGEIVIGRDGVAQGCQCGLGLRGGKNARGDGESRAIALLHPFDKFLPGLVLAEREIGRRVGAVADKIGPGEAGDLGQNRVAIGRNPVDRGVGEARQPQIGRLELVGLCGPLGGHGLGRRTHRQDQRPLGRGAGRAAVERDAKPTVLGRHRGLAVEALHLAVPLVRARTSAGTSSNRSAI